MKIIIVENHLRLSGSLQSKFHHAGFITETALTKAAALESLKSVHAATTICILDLNLTQKKKRGNLDLFHQIRKLHPSLSILIYTGDGDDILCSEAMMAGAIGYYIKGHIYKDRPTGQKDCMSVLVNHAKQIESKITLPEELLAMSVKDCQEAVAAQQTIYALVRTGHNKTQAAKLLNISAKCVHERINKFGLKGS